MSPAQLHTYKEWVLAPSANKKDSLMIPGEKDSIGKKSSIATSKKSFINTGDTFITRRCLATIKRIRQMLISINYITMHLRNKEHFPTLELLNEYSSEVFQMLIDKLERIGFNVKSVQLIKAIHTMS